MTFEWFPLVISSSWLCENWYWAFQILTVYHYTYIARLDTQIKQGIFNAQTLNNASKIMHDMFIAMHLNQRNFIEKCNAIYNPAQRIHTKKKAGQQN